MSPEAYKKYKSYSKLRSNPKRAKVSLRTLFNGFGTEENTLQLSACGPHFPKLRPERGISGPRRRLHGRTPQRETSPPLGKLRL